MIYCNDTEEAVADYRNYLFTKHWRRKREHIAELKKYTCEKCGKNVYKNYQIHHKTYNRIGNENDDDLMCLCNKCHKKEHNITKNTKSKNYVNLKNNVLKKSTIKNDNKKNIITNCNYCNSTELVVKIKDIDNNFLNAKYVGLYCGSCHKLIKWLPKKERNKYIKYANNSFKSKKELKEKTT